MEGGTTKVASSNTDTVVWNPSGPQLPPVVAILPFIVVACLILCLIYKYLRQYWDKKRKSDTYVFVGWNEEEGLKSNDANYTSDPQLNSLVFKENEAEDHLIGSSTPSPTVYHQNVEPTTLREGEKLDGDKLAPTAVVETSSQSVNGSHQSGTIYNGYEEASGSNTETLPLTKRSHAATESDV